MRSQLKIAIFIALTASLIAAVWLRQPSSRDVLLSAGSASPVSLDGREALAVTLEIENRGGPDMLLSASSPEAEQVMFMGAFMSSDSAVGLPLPGDDRASLSMDGAHAMLFGLDGAPEPGRLVPITLEFEHAGEVRTKAKIAASPVAMSSEAMSSEVMSSEVMSMGRHGHGARRLEVRSEAAPSIALSIEPNGAGWRVRAATTKFRFAPEKMDGPHGAGEGHGHLYVDGLKLGRMTEPTFDIGPLPAGERIIRVSLNTNDHRAYAVAGEPIMGEARIVVK